MEQTDFSPSDSLKTWGLLVALLLVGTLAVAVGLPRGLALWVIFGAAIAEAYVIGRYYMRLRSEDVLIYILALLPVALVIVLAFVLVPDIVSTKAGREGSFGCGNSASSSRRVPNAARRLPMVAVPVPLDRQGKPIRRWAC